MLHCTDRNHDEEISSQAILGNDVCVTAQASIVRSRSEGRHHTLYNTASSDQNG